MVLVRVTRKMFRASATLPLVGYVYIYIYIYTYNIYIYICDRICENVHSSNKNFFFHFFCIKTFPMVAIYSVPSFTAIETAITELLTKTVSHTLLEKLF